MTAKPTRKNYRFSELTARQLEALAAAWKLSETRIIELLIDRESQKQKPKEQQQ